MALPYHDIHIHWSGIFKPIHGLKTDHQNNLFIEREIVPIILVPGIMGSRLKNKEGKRVWDPDDIWFMFAGYGRRKATSAKRKALLIGKEFHPDSLVPIDETDRDQEEEIKHRRRFCTYPGAVERGWASVAWKSYGSLLKALQNESWSEPTRHCFEFPVHAFGYNWTASNNDSGKKLADYIDEVIQKYRDKERLCEKVILITHSMGGLVVRTACKNHGAESKVTGIFHGVQPATGSPAAYWRMKAGFERPGPGPTGSLWDWLKNPIKMAIHKGLGTVAAWVLGSDGEEVTSLLGNMPGGLELLPNKRYTDNKGNREWLNQTDSEGRAVTLPKGNPYREIYLAQEVYYRLVDPKWLDPGKREKSSKKYVEETPWDGYAEHLKTAEQFHDTLGDYVHPNSDQFYSTGVYTTGPDRLQAGGRFRGADQPVCQPGRISGPCRLPKQGHRRKQRRKPFRKTP